MSKTQSLIEDDYNPEEVVDFPTKERAPLRDEVVPTRTANEVWQDLGTQSKIVLVCTGLICFSLAAYGIAGCAIGGVIEYELNNNTTIFARNITANHTFDFNVGGVDWCQNASFLDTHVGGTFNQNVSQIFYGGSADTNAKKSLAYGAVLVVSAAFLGVFGFDGVVQENKYELIMFILIAYFCLIRVGWQFFSFLVEKNAENYVWLFDPKLTKLSWVAGAVAFITLLFVVYTTYQTVRLFRSGDFNWIRYRLVGLTDKRLECAFLFVDILQSYAFWINIGVVFFTIGWSAFIAIAVRRERPLLVWVALAFTVAEPAYIIYKLFFLFNENVSCEQRTIAISSPISLFVVSGVLAVACRVVLVILTVKNMQNFGPGGLKDKVWDREDALTQRSKKASVDDYATYKV